MPGAGDLAGLADDLAASGALVVAREGAQVGYGIRWWCVGMDTRWHTASCKAGTDGEHKGQDARGGQAATLTIKRLVVALIRSISGIIRSAAGPGLLISASMRSKENLLSELKAHHAAVGRHYSYSGWETMGYA